MKKRIAKKTVKKKKTVRSKKSVHKKKAVKHCSGRTRTASKKNPLTKRIPQQTLQTIYERNIDLGKHISQRVMENIAQQSGVKELPISYNTTCLVLMVRDPNWVYAYWDLSDEKKKEIALFIKRHAPVKSVLRIKEAHCGETSCIPGNHFDIEVPLEVGQWYVFLGMPEHCFQADLGLIDKDGEFYMIAWSNQVSMPRDTPSSVFDKGWKGSFDFYSAMYKAQSAIKTNYDTPVQKKRSSSF